ncbi:alpha/beta hydrolase-fold protein [Alteromonadaceae bacterium BrNp21-10]|nr:alpha/beta hydrolase-fold protein [Alteromonadaceae bacterium BrNp21-10]
MKTLAYFLIAGLLSACTQQSLNSSPAEVTEVVIPGTQTDTLQSTIVDQQYKLLINFPASYHQSDKQYPVVFLLDAQWDFPLVSSIYGEQYFDGFVPEVIIVGITWGGKDPDPNILRRRDFTPTDINQIGMAGGADKFLQFIQSELVPYVETHYRANDNRTLMGSSLGGLFTLYAMFQQPQLFNNYIPSSPAVTWDNNSLSQYSEGFKQRAAEHTMRLFMPVAELEGLYQPVLNFAAFLQTQNYPNLTWKNHVVAGAGHSGVKADGNTRGLQYVFQKPNIALTDTQLQAASGTYQDSQHQHAFELMVEEGKIMAVFPDANNVLKLAAADATHFYQIGQFFQLDLVQNTAMEITGAQIHRYGQTSTYTKVP